MTREQLETLIARVEAHSTNMTSRYHGPQHWRCVSLLGIDLARETPGADPLVALLFGLFHDSMRRGDGDDFGHGARGAQLLERLHSQSGELVAVSPAQFEKILLACLNHTEAEPTGDPVLGVCYDSDRLNLWRVGVEPSARYLSTSGGIRRAEERATASLHRTPLTWKQVLDHYFAPGY